jgi:rhodanese-related sulfurtransferase
MKTQDRQFKNDIYEQIARIGKAIAAPKRVEILDLLCQGPCSVELLAKRTEITVANASKHLQVLKIARLVESRKVGLFVEYRIANSEVSLFLHAYRSIADARIAEIKSIVHSFLEERDALEPVGAQELLQRIKDGEAILIDVRPAEEFRSGHIPGALSVPLGKLKGYLKNLPKGREVVAYCRGPYCIMALDAVAYLKKKGYSAHRLDLGVLDFVAMGKRIESSVSEARQ